MTLAAETRAAVRDDPFLYDALRAGVVNYSAAAEYLDLDGERSAVVAALRRYAEELPDRDSSARDAPVRMKRGVDEVEDPASALLSVCGVHLGEAGGAKTAVFATGDVGPAALGAALARLRTAGVAVLAAGAREGALAVVVGRRDGPDALRTVESALSSVPG
jgi:Arc/MetJ family transcription regulator